MKCIGLDIGTTSISASVVDIAARRQLESRTLPNRFALQAQEGWRREQDADGIVQTVQTLLDSLLEQHAQVCAIGVTGQMHGMVYTSREGMALSPLATWQDQRAGLPDRDGLTYVEALERMTGERTAPGYGLATHFYNVCNEGVPENAAFFCSIMDYAAMRLTGRKTPLVHSSVAASFGLFDRKNACFDRDKLGWLTGAALPEVTEEYALCGTYRGIPVAVTIGDNQASFLGSVQNQEESILVNVGTGSQISLASGYCELDAALELRPLVKGRYLICGAALCGGAAYAMLEAFFRSYAKAAGLPDAPQYEVMNRLAEEAYASGQPPLAVQTTFCGTRTHPQATGSICGIDRRNWTPQALTLGFVQGICAELHGLYRKSGATGRRMVVASGGGVQQIGVMRRVIAAAFGMPVVLSASQEEASLGAALFAAVAAGVLNGIGDFAGFIRYGT